LKLGDFSQWAQQHAEQSDTPVGGAAETSATARAIDVESGWFSLAHEAWPATDARGLQLDWRRLECKETQRILGPPSSEPVWVLVHGIGGVGPEWAEVQQSLSRQPARAVLQFRWRVTEPLGTLSQRLADGLERLLQCAPEGVLNVRVFAHSAGGIVASMAASLLAIPNRVPACQVEVVTVASPLAGLFERDRDEDPSAMFFGVLGSELRYREPSRGVSVTHIRTIAPGDIVMRPMPSGHRANDPRALVPTARVFTLAGDETHVGALLLVARHFGDGDLEDWLVQYQGLGEPFHGD
jgi:pimeloyl-ACP methyl ester carboxylesterase